VGGSSSPPDFIAGVLPARLVRVQAGSGRLSTRGVRSGREVLVVFRAGKARGPGVVQAAPRFSQDQGEFLEGLSMPCVVG